MIQQEVVVETVQEYSEETARSIGELMPHLSENNLGDPITEERMNTIISSDDNEQFVAKIGNTVVGAANMATIITSTETKAYLDNLVTSPDFAGKGIGTAIMKSFIELAIQKGATRIDFTSSPHRTAAHRFYKTRFNAEEKKTVPFQIHLDKDS